MRRHGKIDANQNQIVKALRKAGATVQSLADIGKGCPDIVCGYRGHNWLMEIKNSELAPSQRKLTPAEQDWHIEWRGQVAVVECPLEALKLIGAVA